MESRKLIAFGKNSFVISLPKGWITSNKLNKGDKVFVDDETSELKISPSDKKVSKGLSTTTVNIDGKIDSMIETEIISAYLINHHIIEVTGESVKGKQVFIKKVALNLAGMELMEQTNRKMVFKDFLNVWEVSLANIIRRIDITIRSMLEDSLNAKTVVDYESIVARDQDVNRLTFMAYKVMREATINPSLLKHFEMNHLDLISTWDIITRLEKVGDQTKRVARHKIKSDLKNKAAQDIRKLYGDIIKTYLNTLKSYYTNDKTLAYQIVQDIKSLITRCNRFLDKNHDLSEVYVLENLKSMSSSCKHISYAVISMI